MHTTTQNNTDTDTSLHKVTPEEEQALKNLLGSDVIVTPAAMTKALAWLLSQMRTMKGNSQEEASIQGGKYATVQQLATRYNTSDVTMWRMIRPLVDAGKVRIFKVPSTTNRGRYARYNIADIDAAYVSLG